MELSSSSSRQAACSPAPSASVSARFSSLPTDLKRRVASYLRPSDAYALAATSHNTYRDLALSHLPMKICFKSWYGSRKSLSNSLSSTGVTTTTDSNGGKVHPNIACLLKHHSIVSSVSRSSKHLMTLQTLTKLHNTLLSRTRDKGDTYSLVGHISTLSVHHLAK